MNDIEKYLDGEMNTEERAAFEVEMEHNPALAKDVAFLRQLTEDIQTVELDKRVKQATKNLPSGGRKYSTYLWWAALILAGLLVLTWYFLQKDRAVPQRAISPAVETATVDSLESAPPQAWTEQPSSEEKDKNTNQPSGPFAQIQPKGSNYTTVPAPNLRGQGPKADTIHEALLNALWFTQYPLPDSQLGKDFQQVDSLLRQRDFSKSYAHLQLLERKMPSNDTLFFLKGYCLLEQGEGGEALRYFDSIKNKNLAGSGLLKWYRGLAFLMVGDDENAKKIFTAIAENPTHNFKPQAQRALKMLE